MQSEGESVPDDGRDYTERAVRQAVRMTRIKMMSDSTGEDP